MAEKAKDKLAKVRAKDKLKNDANVHQRNKSRVGKRSGGFSGSPTPMPMAMPGGNAARVLNSMSSLGSGTDKDMQAKKRLDRANKVLAVASKIPVINKYAKVAKKATEAASKAQNAKAGISSLGKNSDNKPVSNEDIEEAQRAERNGEEYKPDSKEQKYTVLTKRQTIILIVLMCSGLVFSVLFLSVILLSAMTDTGGEYYLASKDTPSEDELEETYNSQEDNGESSDSSSSSSSGKSKKANSESTNNLIYVGDSGTVAICVDAYGGTYDGCSTIGYQKSNATFVSLGSMGYDWYKNTADGETRKLLDSNGKSSVFLSMGCNGLDHAADYAKMYNDLAKKYTNANIVAVSVTPVIDEYVLYYPETINDANVVKFNNTLKSNLSSDVIYCDVYSKVKGKVNAPGDGVHYDTASNKLVNDEMLNCIK